jgi:hypothetical protein
MLAAGLAFLLAFIVLRAVSFHHVDLLVGRRLDDSMAITLLEPCGIAAIWMAALRDLRKPRKAPKPRKTAA